MHAFRSHTCAELTKDNVGQTVRLSGWVHRVRDHGGILFIDLRDHYGVTQVLADPDSAAFKDVEKVRSEWCIRIDGEVKARDPELINPKIPTGEVEVFIRELEVLGAAGELPLMVFGDQEYPEETRLRYRFLDLRREKMQKNMKLRSDVVRSIRSRMWDKGFNEFQTPIITASSPEGARDFLVPSRLHPGKFYALPQAPQQFKQLLMVSGFDKYFQIAPCFRDEDPRADRSPTDFYQLDMEMSFVTQQDVFDTIQPVIEGVFEEFGGGHKVDKHWPQISYKDSALWYGTDKPDLRNPIKMQDVSEHFAGSGFAIFAKILEQDGTQIRAIPAPTGGSRKFCDRMNKFAQEQGLPGMGYIFWRDGENGMEAAGPLAKNIGPERTEAIRQQLRLGKGDAAFFLGGKPEAFEAVAGRARTVIGNELGLTDQNRFAFAWIVDFPMYEADEETGKVDFSHNPFSMPQGGAEALEGDPLN
uniref:aspartate--tRNA ligase n=2 Tax=Nioella sp. TaxID=1912091 RepID=UPI0035113011